MTTSKTTVLAAAILLGVAGSGLAQETKPAHDMSTMGKTADGAAQSMLPDICKTGGVTGGMAPMGSMGGMARDEAHTALMDGMDQMNSDMMMGSMVEDIDVAFVCGMIPHHQGAISMAKAELQYGDDEWARAMAQKVIAAQEQEMADMLAWLEERAN